MHTIVRTLKNRLGSSSPIVLVLRAKTPMGKVNPHQPYNRLVLADSYVERGASITILKGNLDLLMLARAKNNQTSPYPHMIKASPKPTTYKILPEPSAPSEPVSGKSFQATLPNCMMANPPCPSGPRGRNTETMTSRGGRRCTVRRWKYITRITIANGTPVPQRM
jgi:hypothetical protein